MMQPYAEDSQYNYTPRTNTTELSDDRYMYESTTTSTTSVKVPIIFPYLGEYSDEGEEDDDPQSGLDPTQPVDIKVEQGKDISSSTKDNTVGTPTGVNSAHTRRTRQEIIIGRWSVREHRKFMEGLQSFQAPMWGAIAKLIGTRTSTQVRTHAQKYFSKLARRNISIPCFARQIEKERLRLPVEKHCHKTRHDKKLLTNSTGVHNGIKRKATGSQLQRVYAQRPRSDSEPLKAPRIKAFQGQFHNHNICHGGRTMSSVVTTSPSSLASCHAHNNGLLLRENDLQYNYINQLIPPIMVTPQFTPFETNEAEHKLNCFRNTIYGNQLFQRRQRPRANSDVFALPSINEALQRLRPTY